MANNVIIQFSELEFKQLIKSCIIEGIIESTPTPHEENKLLSVNEAAKHLNLAKQTLYGFTSNRAIPFIKRGKKLYFKKIDLNIWLEEGKKSSIQQMKSKIEGGKNVK
jgi:excisionase family DNA binding protein